MFKPAFLTAVTHVRHYRASADKMYTGMAGEGGLNSSGQKDDGGTRFVRNSIFLISIELFAKLLGLVLFMLMARVLGASEIGLYESAIAIAGFFGLAVQFGFERMVQREVGRDPSLLFSHLREINLIKLIFSLLSLGAMWAVLALLGVEDLQTAMMVACFTFLYTFLQFNNALFRGVSRPEFEVLSRIVYSVLQLLLGLFALYSGWGLAGVVSMQLIAVGVSVIFAMGVIERIGERVPFSLGWKRLTRHLKAAAPFAALLVVLYFGNQINVVFLAMLSPREEVGYFAAVRRLFDNMTLIPAAITGAFLPVMSRLYCTSIGRFNRTLRFTVKYLFVISAPIAAGSIIVAGPLTVFLYKQEFAPAALTLQILMSSLVFSFWNVASSSLLISRNREHVLIWLFAAGGAINIACNLVFIPWLGHNGAALAVLTTQAIQFAISYFAALRRYLHARHLLALVAGPFACLAVMSAATWAALQFNLWLAILAGIVVYPAALLISGAANRNDLDRLSKIMKERSAATGG